MRYQFTEKELQEVVKNMVIIVDTQEKENTHIIEYFDKKKIKYKIQNLKFGDYSFYLPKGSFKEQIRDIYFTDEITLERKKNIDEIAMNLRDKKTNINEIKKEIIDLFGEDYLAKVLRCDYNRLKQELANLNRYDIRFFILVEDPNFDYNLAMHNYISKYDPNTLKARMKSLESEFRTIIRPTFKKKMGEEIYTTLKAGLRNIFKNESNLELLE